MNRPQDIYGKEIEMGPWYWAKSRTGKIIGTGKFAAIIGSDECAWFVNGTGYSPENFAFVRVADDSEEDFALWPGSIPEPAQRLCERCDRPLDDGNACPDCTPKKPIMHGGKHDWCANQMCEICARRMKAQDQSEADLIASGGIVGAP